MATTLHSSLSDPDLHEPKGVSAATSGQVYVANGSGSGAWTKYAASNVTVTDTAGYFTATDVENTLKEIYERPLHLHASLTDVSNASFILIPFPYNVEIVSIRFVLQASITASDSTVTVTRGGDSASLGTKTITHTGSAEGTTFDFTPSGNTSINATTHKYIKIASDGASGGTSQMDITVSFKRT